MLSPSTVRLRSHSRGQPLTLVALTIASLLMLATSGWADELRYRWQPNQKFSYNITITVEENDKTTTFQGMTHYEVVSANAEQMKITYRGALPEHTKTKNNRASGPLVRAAWDRSGRAALADRPAHSAVRRLRARCIPPTKSS